MRDVDAGEAKLAMQRPQLRAQILPQQRVEIAQRLVEQHDRRPRRQRARERDALLLAAAQHRRQAVGELPALHHLQHLVDPAVAFGTRSTPRARSGYSTLRRTVMCGHSE